MRNLAGIASRALGVLLLGVAAGALVYGQTYKSHIQHPIVRYKMSARLDPQTKKVTGEYTLTWWNHTDDTISDLYFHLYLNAFKNADSTFMRESGVSRRGGLDRWMSNPDPNKWGWVDVDKIEIVGGPDLTGLQTFVHPDDDNAQDQTVMRIVLPKPIAPRSEIQLHVIFTSKLPRARARNGYEGDYYLIAQWFPKIAVFEAAGERGRKQGGWNCHQYHSNTEFYADYGVYDVDLTAPSDYVVGATGYRRSERRNADGTTTYNQYQEDVHDFAWTASPRFFKETRTFDWAQEVRPDELEKWSKILNVPVDQLALRNVDVTFLLEPGHRNVADRYFRAVFNGLKYFGLWYGQYPYDTMTIVDVPRGSATCCMEYPTFITVGTYFWPAERGLNPEGVTVHEFGHQFWYGLVGNNEFEEAWLDEGFNTYSDGKVIDAAYPDHCDYHYFFGMPVMSFSWLNVNAPAFPFAGVGGIPMGPYFTCMDEPERTSGRGFYLRYLKDDNLARNGWQYLEGASYGLNSYTRVGLTLRTLESYLGEDVMARVMRTYQQRWRYRHPSTQDFIDVVNEVSGRNMNWFFEQFFYGSNPVDYVIGYVGSEPVEGKVGLYDEGGKKVLYSEKSADQAFAKSQEKRYRSTVTVQRLGEATAPVDVAVHFENGETVREQWDGQYRWIKYVYEKPSKADWAEIDPEHKLTLDANFTNNSFTVHEDNRGAAKWYARWIFWVENLFFAATFFS
ncbi:MAG TPA: M1 family metallopeptidase [Terriglobia bacterium]|nr:M1 family metallopeptidase [Terriglobia bacterium]